MRIIRLVFLSIFLLHGEDFISNYEYGQMLYNNPRGISCAKCHGKKGDGKYIGQYKKEKNQIKIYGTRINDKTFFQIKESVLKNHDVMPTYSLTDKEIRAIYEYLKKNKKE